MLSSPVSPTFFLHLSLRILKVPAEELLSLHRGQGLEILWRDSLRCPSEEDYIKMVNNSVSWNFTSVSSLTHFASRETGGLLRIGIKLMMACSTTNIDM